MRGSTQQLPQSRCQCVSLCPKNLSLVPLNCLCNTLPLAPFLLLLKGKERADRVPDCDTRSAYTQGRHKGRGGAGPSSSQPALRGTVRGLGGLEKEGGGLERDAGVWRKKGGVGEKQGSLEKSKGVWRKSKGAWRNIYAHPHTCAGSTAQASTSYLEPGACATFYAWGPRLTGGLHAALWAATTGYRGPTRPGGGAGPGGPVGRNVSMARKGVHVCGVKNALRTA